MSLGIPSTDVHLKTDLSPIEQGQLTDLITHQARFEGVPPLRRGLGQGSSICAVTIFLAEQALDSPISQFGNLSSAEQGQKIRDSLPELGELEFHPNYANLGDDELGIRFMGAIRRIAETDINLAQDLVQRVLD